MACEICGGEGWLWVVTDEYPDGAYRPCRCSIEAAQRKRSERLLAESGITLQQLMRWRFETFDLAAANSTPQGRERLAECVADLRAYAAEPAGWRVLQGMYGCGKTHLAYAIAATRARARKPVYVSNVPDLLDMLRRGYDDASYDRRLQTLKEVELLVLDDLGTEHATPFALEKLYQVIDARYRDCAPLVVTTNRNLYEEKELPGRIVSRLLDVDMSRVWTLPAADYRRRDS